MTAHPPTADRMRHDISRGMSGDKVNHPDPAAAPLGTDDEAAGKPQSKEELRMASATTPSKPMEGTTIGVGSAYVVIVILTIAVVMFAALWR